MTLNLPPNTRQVLEPDRAPTGLPNWDRPILGLACPLRIIKM